jgi:hypothetical protein
LDLSLSVWAAVGVVLGWGDLAEIPNLMVEGVPVDVIYLHPVVGPTPGVPSKNTDAVRVSVLEGHRELVGPVAGVASEQIVGLSTVKASLEWVK